jgi:hypothetical protein
VAGQSLYLLAMGRGANHREGLCLSRQGTCIFRPTYKGGSAASSRMGLCLRDQDLRGGAQ